MMIYARETSIIPSSDGDTTLQAILDLDHDLSLHFSSSDYILTQCAKKISNTEKGTPRGVCELDSETLVPTSRLPVVTALKLPAGTVPPSGTVALWPSESVPSGWAECDGSKYNIELYPDLFSAIEYSFGGSEEEGEFGIPDLRGYFIRCSSHGSGIDPDAYYRDERPDGETGDNIGTIQSSENLKHTHTFTCSTGVAGYGAASFFQINSAGSLDTIVADGYEEGFPSNISVMWIIKL